MINVQNIIDQASQKWSDDKSSLRNKDRFHVSDAGLCYRSRYFKRLGIPSTRVTPVGALRKMLAGEAGHEKLQAILQASGALISSEETLETPDIIGHYDAMIKDGKTKVLLEFKTVEKWSMAHIKKDGPKKEHVIQMLTYWDLLRREKKNASLLQATLVYVMREDFQSVSFDYLWNDDMHKMVLSEWLGLLEAWKKQELPICTCMKDYGGHGVSYCKYQDGPETCCSEDLIEKAQLDAVQV
jgi:hypothetical protein